MSYRHQYEVEMQDATPSTAPAAGRFGIDIAVTGNRAKWSPGCVPHIIRMVGIVPDAGPVRDAAVHIGFNADISTQGTATRIGKIVLPTTVTAAGAVIYWKPTYTIRINPGRIVIAAVTAAATAASTAKIMLLVEPSWEEPGNVTSMTSTT